MCFVLFNTYINAISINLCCYFFCLLFLQERERERDRENKEDLFQNLYQLNSLLQFVFYIVVLVARTKRTREKHNNNNIRTKMRTFVTLSQYCFLLLIILCFGKNQHYQINVVRRWRWRRLAHITQPIGLYVTNRSFLFTQTLSLSPGFSREWYINCEMKILTRLLPPPPPSLSPTPSNLLFSSDFCKNNKKNLFILQTWAARKLKTKQS